MVNFTCTIATFEEIDMTIERQLESVLKAPSSQDDGFVRQLDGFKRLEKRLSRSGYAIEKKHFSIPLMERLNMSYINDL